MVCRQLNMEESVAEIMTQLGTDENGKVSFQDFTRCHRQLVQEIRKEEIDLSLKSGKSSQKKLRDRITSWPTSSDNSLGRWDHAPLSLLYYVRVASPSPHPTHLALLSWAQFLYNGLMLADFFFFSSILTFSNCNDALK